MTNSLAAQTIGSRCTIQRHHATGSIRQRLLDLGFIPATEVEVIRCATLGDPLEIRIGDSSVAVRRGEASLIEVAPAEF